MFVSWIFSAKYILCFIEKVPFLVGSFKHETLEVKKIIKKYEE